MHRVSGNHDTAMRILHISKYAFPEKGGVETFVRDLSTEQVRQGHAVSVLCHRSTSLQPAQSSRIDRVTIMRCPTLCTTAFTPVAPTFPLHLRAAIKQERPDVVHLHLPNPAVLFTAFIPAHIPLVIHWHADVQGSTNKTIRTLYPAYRFFEQHSLARAKRIITTSPPYLESSPSLARWRDKCTTIPLGIDLNRYPEENTRPTERPMVLSVGRFAFYKGFEHLVRAASLVKEADFTIVGDGPERPRVAQIVEHSGISERVHLPGAVSDDELRRLLQQATIFCLPSVDRGEAFGVTLLEAMRYGLPLISTAIPGSGTGWVNRNGVTGMVVPPASPEALASAITTMINDPEMLERYEKAAKRILEEDFNISAVAESINRIYAACSAS